MTATETPITPEAVRVVLYRHGFTETEVKGVLAELGETPAVTSRPVAAALRRAKTAEAKLATLAAHNRQHLELPGSCCPHLAQENLAIIGSEEGTGMSELKTWGRIAYEAYVKSSGGKSIRGEQLPGWDDQDAAIAQHWEAAGHAVARLAAPELFTAGIEDGAL